MKAENAQHSESGGYYMSETKKILQRCEIAQADKWAIEDLYATDEAWSADLEKLKVMTQQLAAYAGHRHCL